MALPTLNASFPPALLSASQSIRACKWVDEVVENVPYVLNETYLSDVVFGQHKVDYVVHGDDPCLDADGNDVFATSKAAGKYREIKRTEGVSTTDLVGRMLLMSKEHHSRGTSPALSPASSPNPKAKHSQFRQRLGRVAGFAGFLPTSRRIAEFSAPNRRPGPNDRIVYVDGAFDLLLPCHIRFLEKAKELGDFLIVGVHRVMSRRSIRPCPSSCTLRCTPGGCLLLPREGILKPKLRSEQSSCS
jgi:ethanolamine-phosphate cytidylyltransferase